MGYSPKFSRAFETILKSNEPRPAEASCRCEAGEAAEKATRRGQWRRVVGARRGRPPSGGREAGEAAKKATSQGQWRRVAGARRVRPPSRLTHEQGRRRVS